MKECDCSGRRKQARWIPTGNLPDPKRGVQKRKTRERQNTPGTRRLSRCLILLLRATSEAHDVSVLLEPGDLNRQRLTLKTMTVFVVAILGKGVWVFFRQYNWWYWRQKPSVLGTVIRLCRLSPGFCRHLADPREHDVI